MLLFAMYRLHRSNETHRSSRLKEWIWHISNQGSG